ncbi:AraC family transcriptional regulator [Rhizobium sp. TRM95111]|uniref:helix-turn-helix transcriptional regulator n=1 Tax=Rhizobium alarense TaxID=2846851 RepID=UPI001F231AD7|nr:AraC family transcriptional regulator [Rhizobium alarense]MCF3642744.1 AraC family transcriptional regulator [Rhizobium alarense]
MPQNASIDFAPRFEGSNFEQMVEIFAGRFGPFDASPIGRVRDFPWKADVSLGGSLTLVTGQYFSGWGVKAVPETSEWLSIILPRAGALDVTLGQTIIEGLPGQLLLVNNHEAEYFLVRGEPHLSDVLRLDWTAVTQAFAATLDTPQFGALALSPIVDLSTPAGQMIGNLVRTIIDGLRNDGPLLHSPIAMSHLTQALADLIIRSVPHRFSHLLNGRVRMIAPWHVHRAIEFMRANVDQPITMPMVAAAAGVSLRALQSGFMAFKETTPSAYLRTIRLQAVRKNLLDPANRQTLREICLKWGFFHFGRFSALYKTSYGEYPSETMKRTAST